MERNVGVEISIVIPLYNEEKIIEMLYAQIHAVMNSMSVSWELVFVDDGSIDSTRTFIRDKAQTVPNIRGVLLSRNYGHEAALTAGMSEAKGSFIILMDGDLQDPPALIVSLYQAITVNNYDIVVARKEEREEVWYRRLMFSAFYGVMKMVSNIDIHTGEGAFSIMRSRVCDELLRMDERNRYLSGMRRWVGFRQGEILYRRPDRVLGSPKQTMTKLFKMGADAVFSFSTMPIKLIWMLGALGIVAAASAAVNVMYQKIFSNTAILGWTSTIILIVFFGSLILLSLGLVGEYVHRIYDQVRRRPLYIIQEIVD